MCCLICCSNLFLNRCETEPTQNKLCLLNTNAPCIGHFLKIFQHADDLNHRSKESLKESIIIQKLRPMLKFFAKRHTDIHTG